MTRKMKTLWILLALSIGSVQAEAKAAKNVILIIGDGMGPPQLTLALVYARQSPDSPYKEKGLNLERMMRDGDSGFMLTYPKGSLVVDSAASATQLATGHFSGSEMIGVDYLGNKTETILEKAKKAGKATGLVSSARLTHATPASFAAHQPHRSLENEIAEDMIETGADVMLSAGYRHFLPGSVGREGTAAYKKWRALFPKTLSPRSSRADEIDLLSRAQKAGYTLAFDYKTMNGIESGKILGLFGASGMPTGIDEARYENDPNRTLPTLRDMTSKALESLAKDKDGFFLMVEGGQIDWAGHANDAGWMLNEMLQFDKAIGRILDFAEKDGETLVVLTADHETGSFGFSYSKNDVPKPVKLDGDAFKTALFAPRYNFGDPDVLRKLRVQKMTIEEMLEEFDQLPAPKKTPKALVDIVNANMEFTLTLEEAREILASGSPSKGKGPMSVIMDEFKKTYGYYEIRSNLIGHALSKEQQVVWGTGNHTMTMVPLVVFGPDELRKPFDGVMHSTKVSQTMMKALGLTFH